MGNNETKPPVPAPRSSRTSSIVAASTVPSNRVARGPIWPAEMAAQVVWGSSGDYDKNHGLSHLSEVHNPARIHGVVLPNTPINFDEFEEDLIKDLGHGSRGNSSSSVEQPGLSMATITKPSAPPVLKMSVPKVVPRTVAPVAHFSNQTPNISASVGKPTKVMQTTKTNESCSDSIVTVHPTAPPAYRAIPKPSGYTGMYPSLPEWSDSEEISDAKVIDSVYIAGNIKEYKFLPMNYPHVVLRNGNKSAKRIDSMQDNYVYISDSFQRGDKIALVIESIDRSSAAEHSFTVGFTTCSAEQISNSETIHLTTNCKPWLNCNGLSCNIKIRRLQTVGNKVTFERTRKGFITFHCNDKPQNIPMHFRLGGAKEKQQLEGCDLWPFIQLDGIVSSVKIVQVVDGDVILPGSQMKTTCTLDKQKVSRWLPGYPAIKWAPTDNITITDRYTLTLNDGSYIGHVFNHCALKAGQELGFQIKGIDKSPVNGTNKSGSISFAVVEVAESSEGRPELGEISDRFYRRDIVKAPEIDMKFKITRTYSDGGFHLETYSSEHVNRRLFGATKDKNYYPVFFFDGIINSIRVLPLDKKENHVINQGREFRNSRSSSVASDGPRNERSNSVDSNPTRKPRRSRRPRLSREETNREATASAASSIKDTEETSNECQICDERSVNCTIVACGHQRTCFECADILFKKGQPCPWCRQPITMVLPIFK